MVEECNCRDGCNWRNSASSPALMISSCSGGLISSLVVKMPRVPFVFYRRVSPRIAGDGMVSLAYQLLSINKL